MEVEMVNVLRQPQEDVPAAAEVIDEVEEDVWPLMEVPDGPRNSVEQIASLGVLKQICQYLSFTELKHLRQVCKSWANVAGREERFVNCTGKFGQNWILEVGGMTFAQCHKFRSMYFRYFPFERNTAFEPYFRYTGSLLTRLKFKFMKMQCDDVVAFLQRCPHLEEVHFANCKFHLIECDRQELRGKTVLLKTCCLHTQGLNELRGTTEVPVIPPRIHTLRFTAQNWFPNCVMDLLFERANGVITKFAFDDAGMPNWKRIRYFPTKDALENRMFNFLVENHQLLNYFSFMKVHRADKFLERLVNAGIHMAPRDLLVAQKSSWDNRFTYPPFMNFVLSCQNTVETLYIRFLHSFDGARLTNVMGQKTNVKKVTVDTIWVQHNEDQARININFLLQRWPDLEELILWDRNRARRHSMTFDYLRNLPRGLKKLTFFHFYQPIQEVRDFLTTDRARALTALNIESGQQFTDAMMQTIISELVNLEELSVSNSKELTDSGLTGLNLPAVKMILKCKSGIMYTHELDKNKMVGRPVSEVSKLRKLSFCMSRKVSDISIYLGFRFPQLREINLSWCLDVTDLGIHWLCKNNPALERIILMKNRNITHYGLNKVIKDYPTIKNIHTSRSCRDRKFGRQLNYVEDPRFEKIVSYHKWCEKRPTAYGEF